MNEDQLVILLNILHTFVRALEPGGYYDSTPDFLGSEGAKYVRKMIEEIEEMRP